MHCEASKSKVAVCMASRSHYMLTMYFGSRAPFCNSLPSVGKSRDRESDVACI